MAPVLPNVNMSLRIRSMRKAEVGCIGKRIYEECWLYLALVKYNLNTEDNSATFQPNSTWKDDLVIERINKHGYRQNLLTMVLQQMGRMLFRTRYRAQYIVPLHQWSLALSGDPENNDLIAYLYEDPSTAYVAPKGKDAWKDPCDPQFISPMDDIIKTYRDLALHISIIAAADLPEDDHVTRAVFWAWNSSSIPLINYFGLEGLVDPFNFQEKVGLQDLLMPKGIGTYLRYVSSLVAWGFRASTIHVELPECLHPFFISFWRHPSSRRLASCLVGCGRFWRLGSSRGASLASSALPGFGSLAGSVGRSSGKQC
ncbi:hypothetical protein QBC32DRAFT_94173 [Pseudoneurospora amorphoporcata]|uniref:Uncharacterized protein n=1 Tax=Pseudoneurospora amorphoporcata TaxID=241081 RepID=A0AAN6NJY0_9PEZI|nr:hypothetical protein QBC32DRAFT_94173 [Pseudoneurospora amorphoporcata]